MAVNEKKRSSLLQIIVLATEKSFITPAKRILIFCIGTSDTSKGAVTLSIKTFSITTLSMMTLRIMTLIIMTLSIMTLSITTLNRRTNDTQCNDI